MQEKSILLKFDEIFDYEKLPTNEWLTGTFKYAFGNHDIPDNETLSWKECWGKIIIVDINSLANWDNPADDANLLIEDWYMLIDDILELDSMIDEFTEDINDKIVEKYEGVTLDNKSRVRYNGIKRYGKALKKFKEYLGEFRNLQKQKDEYLKDQTLIESFGMYSSFSVFRSSSKPRFPFSECYLDLEKACKVKSGLQYYHSRLMELYAEIFGHDEDV